MDKKSAIETIEKTFNAKFNEENFRLFVNNLLNDIEPKNNHYAGARLWEAYRDHIHAYKRIGKYVDPNDEALDILIVEVKDTSKLERTRTALRNFVIKHLKTFEKDYALVAFYSKQDEGREWRFSFVKLEHQAYMDEEKNRVKIKKEFTPAKRYSFLVGVDEHIYTAKKQLLPLFQNIYDNPTIEEIEDAFSIEKVTDEFFEQYKSLYVKLYEHFEKDASLQRELAAHEIDTARFTKKLLGQIVFLYFLQKKGWMGVDKDDNWGKGDKKFIQKLFEQAEAEEKNFFKDFLQYLFYDALANEHASEGIASYYARFKCKIPFLNGGLFEADYAWKSADITIPSTLFRNDEKTKAGDKGTGVLDVFDRYNFTIKEDEPLEKEVAVDPEMLGKVFENMLEIKERKSKGAFYTPREIVHYMCQESLIHYLDNTTNDEVPKKKIETFIRNADFSLQNDETVVKKGKETDRYRFQLPESIRINADSIDKALTSIKILDPAIGSGAFPVGLLHELVNAQLVLKAHLSKKYFKEKNKIIGLVGSSNDTNDSRYVYRIKRHSIQESIYGVDIDASAIDIARLRLWLSLVVDEDDLDPIETLPNLDYKIIKGNSLQSVEIDLFNQILFTDIEKKKEKLFSVTDAVEKKQLINEINELFLTITNGKKDFDFKLYFSEVWHEKNGFDVVIGNPPYGAKLTAEEKKLFKNKFSDVHMRTPDTFNYFISKGFRLLHDNGVISHIVPNNLFFQSEFEKTRRFLLEKNQFYTGINLGDGVFNSATVPSCIFVASKTRNKSMKYYKYADLRNANKYNINFKSKFQKEKIESILKVPAVVFGIDEREFKIIQKMRSVSLTIDDIAEEMASGISTGGDKIFRVSEEQIDELNLERELLKPVLVGGEIDKYFIKDTKHFIVYNDRNTNIEQYQNTKAYLLQHKDKLVKRSEVKSGVMPWYSLNRQRYPLLFEEQKIIMRQTSDRIRATYDEWGFYVLDSILVFKKNKNKNLHYHFILAMLNSSVNEFVYKSFSQEGGRTFAQVKPKNVRKLFIPKADEHTQILVSHIVSFLLFLKNLSDMDILISFYESLIDSIAYELFLPDEVNLLGKNILKYLNDLKPIAEDMSNEEKLSIIEGEFERLYDPNHPVRNNLETLDSIEDISIINEALK